MSPSTAPPLPIIDPEVEAQLLAYHVGRDTRLDAAPVVGPREVQAEIHEDLWTALMQGAF